MSGLDLDTSAFESNTICSPIIYHSSLFIIISGGGDWRMCQHNALTEEDSKVYSPIKDQRSLEDLGLEFQPMHTPQLTQYTCLKPPQASLLLEPHN